MNQNDPKVVTMEHKINDWLSRHGVSHPETFLNTIPERSIAEMCISSQLLDDVQDWKRFLMKGVSALKKDPLCRELYGESLDGLYTRRTKFIQITKATGDAVSQERINLFAAWILFEYRKNNVYIPMHTIQGFCRKQNIDLSDLFSVLIRHPNYKNLYTSKDIRNSETKIETWIKQAASLGIEPEQVDCLDDNQNDVVQNILKNSFSVLQGSAGCGKTTTISEVIKLISREGGVNVVAAAYTHKAKKCIEQRIKKLGIENIVISTIHSLIYYLKANKLKRVFMILDESSMIDYDLLGELAKVMLTCCGEYQLCFVGDYFQIQPVGRGEFFRFLVDNGVNVSLLTKCYRTDKPDLFGAFEDMRNGKLSKSSDHFKVHFCENDKEISSHVGKFIFKHLDNFKILCWQNKHIWLINQWVQKALLQKGKISQESYKGFHKGDKVVYIGDNGEHVTNATSGIVTEIGNRSLKIHWDGVEKPLTYNDVKDVALSYAISVHKSQGSEYDHILVVCYDVEKMKSCLDRRWLYTSVTRAQKNVEIITTRDLEEFVNMQLSGIPIHNACI